MYSSLRSFLCWAIFLKHFLLYWFTLGQCKWYNVEEGENKKGCNHVEISFIPIKIFKKSLYLPSLISLLSICPTPFPWNLATHVGFGRKKKMQWLNQENCLFALRSTLRTLWAAHGGSLILGNLFLPDVFPRATFLQCPFLFSIRINTQDLPQ